MSSSRYLTENVVIYKGDYVFYKSNEVDKSKLTNFTYSVISDSNKRLDQVAKENYGDPKMWWILADVNNISNPFENLYGRTIKIPNYQELLSQGVIH